MENMTIRDFLDDTVARYGQRPAQIFYRNGAWCTRTYSELRSRVLSVATAVRKSGFVPGKHNIALMLENCPEWQEIYLALVCVGLTVIPIDPKLKSGEVAHILTDSGAVGIFTGSRQLETLSAITASLDSSFKFICLDNVSNDAVVPNLSSYQPMVSMEVDSESGEWFKSTRPGEDTIASLIYTSGTTGAPKGVMLSHGNFTSDACAAVEAVQFNADDNFLAVLPFFHAYSFTGNFMLPLCVGACTSFVRSIKTVSEDMKISKPSILFAVPLLAEKIYAKIESGIRSNVIARILLAIGLGGVIGRKVVKSLGGKLRFIGIGGAPADKKVLVGLNRIGIPTLEGYGLTECAPLVAYPAISGFKPGSVGKVLSCMEYKIVEQDETGAGELCVRGPNVMKGYYKNQAATEEVVDSDGFFHTGDVVRADKDGNITICGRRKALVVNREGKNIYPEEIEQVVGRLPYVAESLALSYFAKGEAGERIGLMVEANDEACKPLGKTEQERDGNLISVIIRHCKERLADYKLPRKIVIRHKPFELTSTMKVKRIKYKGHLDDK